MGSATSVEAYPERLTEAQCRDLVGEAAFDLPKFNEVPKLLPREGKTTTPAADVRRRRESSQG